MSVEVNVHEFKGKVLAKSPKYNVGSKGMVKSMLYCEGDYIVNDKPRTQQAKFVCFSFADNKSRIDDVLPGDIVSFGFTLSGLFKPDEKDYQGAPKCFTDPVINTKVEILDIKERQLYNNDPSQRPTPTEIKPKNFEYPVENMGAKEDADEQPNDLPF